MLCSDAMTALSGVEVRHRIAGFLDRWVIAEGPLPESAQHDATVELLKAILVHFANSSAGQLAVYRNLAIRIDERRPNVGFDPDLCLVQPAPPDPEHVESLKLWQPGHLPPRLVVEVVSRRHPAKDYAEVPEKCAALGVEELVVFDPLQVGPRVRGGPSLLQQWLRMDDGGFERTSSGPGPVRSVVLGGFWLATNSGTRLRLADDSAGGGLWPTGEEAERAAKEVARTAEEAERLAKEAALAELAALRAELGSRSR